MPATFTVKQVADILGYSTNSIYSFLKAKRIKGVRVGKGRFRIPQSELDRLLLVKGGTSSVVSLPKSPVVVSQMPYVASMSMTDVHPSSYASDEFIDPIAANRSVEVPSLFDWFVGVGSIIVGFAMFLFSKSYEEFAVTSSVSWILMMRTIFIAAGFGLLLSDMSGKKSGVWSSIFRFVLLFVYLVYSVLSMHSGAVDVGVLFGLMAPLLVVSFRSSALGVHLFILYSLCASLYVFFMMGLQHAALATSVLMGISEAETGMLFGILGLISVALTYLAYRGSTTVLRIGIIAQCVILIASSYQYAQQMMWGRSLFILMTAIFTSFVPLWKTLTFAHKRDRSFVFGVIGSLLLLFVFVIGCIHIMQTNMISVISRELDNKVVYGKVSVESALESAKSSVASLASNPLLIDSMKPDKAGIRVDLSKTVVGTNTSLRQLSILSASGDVLTTYPLSESRQANSIDENYFVKAVKTKQMVVSDVLESKEDGSTRTVVVIAMPILSQGGAVQGVVAGELDIDAIGLKLQQLSSESTGEYAMLIDTGARYIIHPDHAQIGLLSDAQDPIRLGLSGGRGITDGYFADGISTLTAVDSVHGSKGWSLAIRVPRSSVLRMHELSVVVLTFLISVSTAIMALFFISHRKKTNLAVLDSYGVQTGGGS